MSDSGDQVSGNIPSSQASAMKVLVDSITTNFGMAVMVLAFIGFGFIALASGFGDLSGGLRAGLLFTILTLMIAILGGAVWLRHKSPEALSGPPPPSSDVEIQGSDISPELVRLPEEQN